MDIPTLSEIGNVAGKRVLVRAGLNVPIKDGKVANDFRIKKALETIEYLTSKGARVLVVSHIGRDPEETLAPVFERFKKDIPGMQFVTSYTSSETEEILNEMNDGDVVLFENVRANDGEKKNDPEFAKQLAELAEVFVNDAFPASHRAHASIVGVPEYLPGFAGRQLEREITELSKALEPIHPSLFIVGGAKFATKAPILRMALDKYEACFVGGALANDFLKAKGYEVGESLVSDETEGIVDLVAHPHLMLPTDVVVQGESGEHITKGADEVAPGERILDVGPESINALIEKVDAAKSVLWNGPMGYYEGGFNESTERIAERVAAGENQSIVGGGDTIAAIEKLGLAQQFTFLSTGGGAMLDYLADGSLPGLEALKK